MLAKGLVIDSKTQDVLPKATIFVTDKNGNIIDENKKTSSDKDGEFTIDVFPADYLTISYVGYHNQTVSIKDFSSDINIIPLKYNKGGETTSDLFKGDRSDEVDNGVLRNKPIKWYYWAAFAFIGYYIYTKIKSEK